MLCAIGNRHSVRHMWYWLDCCHISACHNRISCCMSRDTLFCRRRHHLTRHQLRRMCYLLSYTLYPCPPYTQSQYVWILKKCQRRFDRLLGECCAAVHWLYSILGCIGNRHRNSVLPVWAGRAGKGLRSCHRIGQSTNQQRHRTRQSLVSSHCRS